MVFGLKAFNANRLISIGISKHLMQSLGSALVSKFDFIDFSFHENDMLFELVDSKNLILRLSPNNMIRLTRFRKRLKSNK
jgi:hypothetical protein